MNNANHTAADKKNRWIKKPVEFGKNIIEQIPIREYDEEGFFILADHRIMNIFEIQGQSFYNASEDEINNKVYRLREYYRMQQEDIKLIFMNYPTNTTRQQNFLESKLAYNENPYYKKWLEKELGILVNLEKYRTDRVAFILIFANNENAYNRQVELLKQKSSLFILDMSYKKKITVLKKLNNMNKSIKV